MDTGAWKATIHQVTESDMTERLSMHISGQDSLFPLKEGRVSSLYLPSMGDIPPASSVLLILHQLLATPPSLTAGAPGHVLEEREKLRQACRYWGSRQRAVNCISHFRLRISCGKRSLSSNVFSAL